MPPRKPSTRRKKVAAASLGLAAPETATVDSTDLKALSTAIAGDGGVVLAQYRDPVGGKPLILASLPVDRVEPTPYQRDASDTHVKRLMGGRREDRPLPRSDHRRAQGRRLLDAEREPSPAGVEEARLPRGHRARRAGRGRRVQDPRAEHREGAQPAREVARDDPHGARAREGLRRARSELRLRVRAAVVSHARRLLRRTSTHAAAAPISRF